jgi:ATP:ADP antiporter, AAA family
MNDRKTWVERTLSVITDVRPGEGVSALLLATNGFFLLAFYYILKVIRDALILSESGAVAASYSSAGQALLLLAFVPAYSALASRVNRLRLICGVTLFFASNLVAFYLVGVSGIRIGIPFYLWVGVFNMTAVAQFWAFANDLYSTERGKRLFPILGLGANVGALVGSAATALIFGGIGPYPLLLIAAAGLLIPVALTIWVNTRERATRRDAAAGQAERPLAKANGFKLVFSQRYLFLMAVMVLLLNLVNTLGGFVQNTLVRQYAVNGAVTDEAGRQGDRELTEQERGAVAASVGSITGGILTWVNLLTMLFQALLVSRIFKAIGVRGALFILPFIALGGYMAIALLPVLGVVRIAKILENSTDYSVSNTTRQALFLPLSREAKYTAKQAIDAFFVRFGDFLQAGVVLLGTTLAFGVRHYALLNIAFVVVWLFVARAIAKEHKKLVPVDAEERAA